MVLKILRDHNPPITTPTPTSTSSATPSLPVPSSSVGTGYVSTGGGGRALPLSVLRSLVSRVDDALLYNSSSGSGGSGSSGGNTTNDGTTTVVLLERWNNLIKSAFPSGADAKAKNTAIEKVRSEFWVLYPRCLCLVLNVIFITSQ